MPSRRIVLVFLVPALVGATVGVGLAASRSPAEVDLVDEVGPTLPVVGGPNPSANPSPSPSPSPTPSVSPSPPPSAAPSASQAYDIAGVQQRLRDLGYYVDAVDGLEGPALKAAVTAFQKVNGLGADGVVGPRTLAALAAPVTPELRGGEARRVEIDLTRQVLHYVEGGVRVRTVPVSSGNGARYETKSGGTATALTPVGTFRVERKIKGLREADLGSLYDPMYFYRGWAIHGSNSVPAHPASHGCVRVTRADALWLFPRLAVGTQVILYGGTHTFERGDEEEAGTTVPAGDTAEDTAEPSPSPSPSPTPSPAAPAESPAPSTPPPTADPTPAPQTPTEEPSAPATPPPSQLASPAPTEPDIVPPTDGAVSPSESEVPAPAPSPPAAVEPEGETEAAAPAPAATD